MGVRTIGAFEVKTHFSALLKEVEHGGQVLITKHGHPVARLIPMVEAGRPDVRQVIKRLKEFGRHNTLGGLDWKMLRDEGRR